MNEQTHRLKYLDHQWAPSQAIEVRDGSVVRLRRGSDYVDGYARGNLDRSGALMNMDMYDTRGHSPISIASQRLETSGSVVFLDGGCGTGRTLYIQKKDLLSTPGVDSSSVRVIGVNDADYSDESSYPEVRAAVAAGEVEYVVSDLIDVELEPSSVDVITMYEVLIHNDPHKIVWILENLLPSLKPNGVLFAGLNLVQREDPYLSLYLGPVLREKGYSLYERRDLDRNPELSRAFMTINHKPNQTTSPQSR